MEFSSRSTLIASRGLLLGTAAAAAFFLSSPESAHADTTNYGTEVTDPGTPAIDSTTGESPETASHNTSDEGQVSEFRAPGSRVNTSPQPAEGSEESAEAPAPAPASAGFRAPGSRVLPAREVSTTSDTPQQQEQDQVDQSTPAPEEQTENVFRAPGSTEVVAEPPAPQPIPAEPAPSEPSVPTTEAVPAVAPPESTQAPDQPPVPPAAAPPDPEAPPQDPVATFRPLLETIAIGESHGNYNAYFGNGNNTSRRFTEMTLQEVLNWQADYVASGSPSSAVGKYQFIQDTLASTVDGLGLDRNLLFDEPMQDRLAVEKIMQRGGNGFLSGDISAEDFASNLAHEWASLPCFVGQNPNQSCYAGDGLNSALISMDQILQAIAQIPR